MIIVDPIQKRCLIFFKPNPISAIKPNKNPIYGGPAVTPMPPQ